MNRLSSIGLCLALSTVCAQGWAETVVPLKGQSAQQVQVDINDCHNVAASSASSDAHVGGRVRGAAVGAAAGAAGAEVRDASMMRSTTVSMMTSNSNTAEPCR